MASASGAIEAYIALSYTHLRLGRPAEARESVLAALTRASDGGSDEALWKSLCTTLAPLLPQVPELPADATAPLLRACAHGAYLSVCLPVCLPACLSLPYTPSTSTGSSSHNREGLTWVSYSCQHFSTP